MKFNRPARQTPVQPESAPEPEKPGLNGKQKKLLFWLPLWLCAALLLIGNLGVDVGLDFLVYLYIDDFFFRAGFFYFRAGFFVFCLGFFAFRFGFFAFCFGFFVFRDDFVVCRVVVWIL